MAKWMLAQKKADFEGWAKTFSIDPVIARILRNRDLMTEEDVHKFLYGEMEDLPSASLMLDFDKAVYLIQDAIRAEKKIRVIGDYDVDGVCATFILKQGIERCGGLVDYAIPHRIRDGYGLNENLIREAKTAGIECIVTCDNGIAAWQEIALAKELGLRVVVTDHHEVPMREREILPPGDAVVDPKRAGDSYPFSGICGAVVALKIIEALWKKEKQQDVNLWEEFLTVASLATICDVMELKEENRILVKRGLSLLANTTNVGLQALLQVNELTGGKISGYHVGFVLGPCLNATGRLDTAVRAIELLEERDENRAITLAGELKSLNDARKELTEKGLEEAFSLIVQQTQEQSGIMDAVLVLFLPNCHESIAGIIAGRVRERYNRPTFIITRGEEGLKGSGRSIDAYPMVEKLTECRELLTKYGGHKLAAGLSFPEENLEELRRRLNERAELEEKDFIPVLHLDAAMPLSYVTEELVRELAVLEPFGVGNPKPLFAQKNVLLISGRVMGKNRNVGKYRVLDETGNAKELVCFSRLEDFHIFLRNRFGEGAVEELLEGKRVSMPVSIAYYPDVNVYNGRSSLQFVLQDWC